MELASQMSISEQQLPIDAEPVVLLTKFAWEGD